MRSSTSSDNWGVSDRAAGNHPTDQQAGSSGQLAVGREPAAAGWRARILRHGQRGYLVAPTDGPADHVWRGYTQL